MAIEGLEELLLIFLGEDIVPVDPLSWFLVEELLMEARCSFVETAILAPLPCIPWMVHVLVEVGVELCHLFNCLLQVIDDCLLAINQEFVKHFEKLEGFYVLPALLLGPSTALLILMNTIKVILGYWLFLLLGVPLSFIHSNPKTPKPHRNETNI